MGKSSAKPKGGGESSENVGELEIGPTGSDPTLSNGTLVNNYDWTKLQVDYYTALTFDSVADIAWGPDGSSQIVITGCNDEDQSIDFHMADGSPPFPAGSGATYPFTFLRDPRDTRTDWTIPGGGGGGNNTKAAKKGDASKPPGGGSA